MKTLAFYFKGQDDAEAARFALVSARGIDEAQVAVAPLVVEGEEGIILALSADQTAQADVVDVVGRHGGRLVAEVPDEWL